MQESLPTFPAPAPKKNNLLIVILVLGILFLCALLALICVGSVVYPYFGVTYSGPIIATQGVQPTNIPNLPTLPSQPESVPTETIPPVNIVERKVCVATGGKWFPGTEIGFEMVGVFNASRLADGMALQQKWPRVNKTGTNYVELDGILHLIPNSFEPLHDGGLTQLVACPSADGGWIIHESSPSQFWLVSYLECDETTCRGWEDDINGAPGGDYITYTVVSSFDEVRVELWENWQMLQIYMALADAGEFPTPSEAAIYAAWQRQ